MRRHIGWVRAGVVAMSLGAALAAALLGTSGCDDDARDVAPPPPREMPNDPGCTVTAREALTDPGHTLDAVHHALVRDAGVDADASSDAMSDASPDASSDASVEPSDAGADADGPAARGPGWAADRVRVVACRQGTTLEAIAAPGGEVHVLGAGIRAQVITTTSTDKATSRVLDHLANDGTSNAHFGSTGPSGQPFIVSSSSNTATPPNTLYAQDGDLPAEPLPVASSSDSLSVFRGARASVNAAGSTLLALTDRAALLRTRAGAPRILDLPDLASYSYLDARNDLVLGDDDKPILITKNEVSTSVHMRANGGRSTMKEDRLDLDAAQTVLALSSGIADYPPVVVLGDIPKHEDRSLRVFVPKNASSFAEVEIVPAATHCKPEPNCSNTCTETNAEVHPSDFAITRTTDGRMLLVFVRRRVSRERHYTLEPADTGILCDLFGCSPGCSSTSVATLVSADLVVAEIDVLRREVRELHAVAMKPGASANSVEVKGLTGLGGGTTYSASAPRLSASERDGYLHVTFNGDASGFPAVSTYRLAPAR